MIIFYQEVQRDYFFRHLIKLHFYNYFLFYNYRENLSINNYISIYLSYILFFNSYYLKIFY